VLNVILAEGKGTLEEGTMVPRYLPDTGLVLTEFSVKGLCLSVRC
jgi:hypothetical protein